MTNPTFDTPEDAQHHIRDWVSSVVRDTLARQDLSGVREERATVASGWPSRGQGWPHAVGTPDRRARLRVVVHRYEATVELPPEMPEAAVTAIVEALAKSAGEDPTLAGRARDVRLFDEPDALVGDGEYGPETRQIHLRIEAFFIETADDGDTLAHG
jgi:hypothetical protein